MFPTKTLLKLITLLLAISAVPASAQGLVHAWSQHFGSTSVEEGYGVSVDAAGNVVMTGVFDFTVDFGGGPLTSAGGDDIFLAKFDAAGNHLWSKGFGGVSFDWGNDVAVDTGGNVVMTGSFGLTVDFGGGPLTGAGANDIFLAKFDAAGNHLWSQRFGDTASDWVLGVAFDTSGNVVMTGGFQGTVDFGGGPLTSAGRQDIFLVKFDAAGTHLWSQHFGDTAVDNRGVGIATDSLGNVVMTGNFDGIVDFGGGPLTGAGGRDIFLVKFDATGTHLWSQRFGDTISDWGTDIAVDAGGNVVMTGVFELTVDFGGGPLTSAGVDDIFLAKFDAAGNHLWSKRFGDTAGGRSSGIAIDAPGNVVMTGYFDGIVDFGGGPLTGAGPADVFLARFDAAGDHLWSQRFGDTVSDRGYDVAIDAEGAVVMTGYFDGIVDFGGGPLMGAGGREIFLAKLGRDGTPVQETRTVNRIALRAYPNPLNPRTSITYTMPGDGVARLTIHDAKGRLVTTLMEDVQTEGAHSIQWDGRDHSGNQVASGVYVVRLESRGDVRTQKLSLIR